MKDARLKHQKNFLLVLKFFIVTIRITFLQWSKKSLPTATRNTLESFCHAKKILFIK